MIPSLFGLIVLAVGVLILFGGTSVGALMFLLFCTLFGGSAALILPALGGSSVTPAHLALAFLVARIVAPGSSDIARIPSGVRANVFLGFYAIYGAVTAFILPKIFAGQIEVAPMRSRTLRTLFDTYPLTFTPQNITTAVYLLGTFLVGVCAAIVARRPGSLSKIVLIGAVIAWVHVGFGILDVILTKLGLQGLLDFFRNGSYSQLEQSYGDMSRIDGVFPEASAYAFFGFAWLAFNFECWLRDVRPKTTGPAAVALLLVLLFSTSGSAYLALACYGVVLCLRMLCFPGGFPPEKTVRIGLAVLAGVLVVLAAAVLQPSVASALFNMVHHMTMDKADSDSGRQRTFWAMQGVDAFWFSRGLGIGVGSFRSSSLFTAIIGSTGVFGIATFVAHLWRVAQPLRRSTYLPPADPRVAGAAAAGWAAVVMLIPAAVAGPSPDPGLNFAAFGGLALGWRLAPVLTPSLGAALQRRPVRRRGRHENPNWSAS